MENLVWIQYILRGEARRILRYVYRTSARFRVDKRGLLGQAVYRNVSRKRNCCVGELVCGLDSDYEEKLARSKKHTYNLFLSVHVSPKSFVIFY